MSSEEWRTPKFRQNVVVKIDEAIQRSGMPTTKNAIEMENQVFQRAKSKDEYLSFVARIILHINELNRKKGGAMPGNTNQNIQDPINALQTLARQGQGTGNQMMGLVPQVQQQAGNPHLMQGLNPRPVLQQKLQSQPPQGSMISMGGMTGGMVGSPLSNQTLQMTQPANQQRKAGEGMMQGGYLGGPRGVAPTSQYLRQSPPPSNVSPAAPSVPSSQQPPIPTSSQMVPSPAHVLSPNPQLNQSMQAPMRPMGIAGSPSSSCLNSAGVAGAGTTPSPCSLTQEEVAYREKIRQLSKYIDPLRRMIARVGNEDVEKLSKMKTLLDKLTNPNKRIPLETLLKCEVVLEKLELKRGEASGQPIREQHPLIEAIRSNLQSPVINHTLHRTFGPCMEALFGSDIKTSSISKKKKIEESSDDIPEVLQGEIARLDQRFKVSLSQTGVGSSSVKLLCWLDDRQLPCVPPVSVTVPHDYPASPPRCQLGVHEHSATGFLMQVQAAVEARVAKLPFKYTVSQLLDTWEMSVRQACSPSLSTMSL